MRALRWLTVLGLVLYAGWLAGPLIEHLTGAVRLSRMPHFPPPPARLRPVAGDGLNISLWFGMILAFLSTAVLLAGRSARALFAYGLGALANIALAIGSGLQLRDSATDTLLFLAGALVLGGVLVLNECRGQGHARL